MHGTHTISSMYGPTASRTHSSSPISSPPYAVPHLPHLTHNIRAQYPGARAGDTKQLILPALSLGTAVKFHPFSPIKKGREALCKKGFKKFYSDQATRPTLLCVCNNAPSEREYQP